MAAALAAAGPVDPALVAVLLPLSGRHARVGAELRLAIELAPAAGARRVFLDTGGDPATRRRGVDRAAAEGAIAVLGRSACARRRPRRARPPAARRPSRSWRRRRRRRPRRRGVPPRRLPEAEARAAAATRSP
ncbi:MAG: hypothetical protein HS111_02875 [Kofleriaceae bacterium]|nr:hypothetical protein [Kofleriaceae bacterium]